MLSQAEDLRQDNQGPHVTGRATPGRPLTSEFPQAAFPMLTCRPAEDSDIPFLLRLRQETMNAHLAASGAAVSDEDHWARLMYRFDCAEVLLDGDHPVGLLKVARDSDQWKIIQIQLAPQMQGLGVGRLLLEGIIEGAKRAKVPLVLSVLKANPARSLYERLGFVTVGEGDLEFQMKYEPRD